MGQMFGNERFLACAKENTQIEGVKLTLTRRSGIIKGGEGEFKDDGRRTKERQSRLAGPHYSLHLLASLGSSWLIAVLQFCLLQDENPAHFGTSYDQLLLGG